MRDGNASLAKSVLAVVKGLFAAVATTAVAGNITSVASIGDLQALGTSSSTYSAVVVRGFYSGTTIGGGTFQWVSGNCWPNGGTVFSATGVPTSGAGAGCWFRQYQGNFLMASWFGAKGSNSTSDAALNTATLQAGLNASQVLNKGFMLDQCERYYINNGLYAPLDQSVYQGRPLKFVGCGAPTPFAGNALTGDPNQAHGSILSMVGDRTLFAYHDWANHRGSGEVEIADIRWEGTTSSELVYLQVFTGHSSFHHNQLVQYGTGSGLICATCITSSIEWNHVVGASWNSSSGSRTGTGITIQAAVNGGLAKVANNTSRGFEYGYYIGGGAGNLIKPLFDHNEVSNDTYGWYVTAGTQGAVFRDNYAEGVGSAVFTNLGEFTRIEGTYAFSGFTQFIATGPSTFAGVYESNMPSVQDNH